MASRIPPDSIVRSSFIVSGTVQSVSVGVCVPSIVIFCKSIVEYIPIASLAGVEPFPITNPAPEPMLLVSGSRYMDGAVGVVCD
ncbi:hypothetical protein ES705_38994 [subsurface metagenome]